MLLLPSVAWPATSRACPPPSTTCCSSSPHRRTCRRPYPSCSLRLTPLRPPPPPPPQTTAAAAAARTVRELRVTRPAPATAVAVGVVLRTRAPLRGGTTRQSVQTAATRQEVWRHIPTLLAILPPLHRPHPLPLRLPSHPPCSPAWTNLNRPCLPAWQASHPPNLRPFLPPAR